MPHAFFFAALALQAAAPAPSPAPQPSVQAQFDTASTMLLQEKWREALAAFDALEGRLANGGNRRSLALVRLRRAEALARVDRFAEAEAAIAESLPLLADSDASLAEDRLRAMVTYAVIAELRLDLDEAARRYAAAAGAPGPAALRLRVLRGLVHSKLFSAPAEALAHVGEAEALVAQMAENRRLLGQVATWRGRVLLNQRRLPEAREALTLAVERLGGMGRSVDAADVVARADLAMVQLLLGETDRARRTLALTGAGRYRSGILSPLDARPPGCGADAAPQDVAVIEFAISEEGRVRSAAPVYATRWSAGRAFARAVSGWRFDPTALNNIPPLFRSLNRVEMRCALGAEAQSRAGLAFSWQGLAPESTDAEKADISRLRAELDRAQQERATAPLALFEALTRLAQRPEIDPEETRTLMLRAIVVGRLPNVAPRIDPFRLAALLYQYENPSSGAEATADLARLAEHPVAREDPRVGAALAIMQASLHYYAGRYAEAEALLAPLLGQTPPLGEELRAEALAFQSAARAARGDWEGARAARLALGSGAARCLINPRALPFDSRRSDYPREAGRWGFEGWTLVEGQVTQQGAMTEPRTIIGYPAFVFSSASERLAAWTALAPNLSGDGRPCPHTRRMRFNVAW